MKRFEKEDITLHYRVSGNGNPVFFLHGFLENHEMWDDIVPHFDAISENYVFDLPCHGNSRFNGTICTMAEIARSIHLFCLAYQISNPIIIGHSMGGYIGLELRKLMPLKLVLLHSNFWEDPPAKKKDRNRVVDIVQENKSLLIREAIPHLFAPENRLKCQETIHTLIERAMEIPKEEICASTLGMRDRADHSNANNLNDVILIHGTKDPIIPTSLLEEKLEILPLKPAVHYMENCGHMSIWENPKGLIKLIKLTVFQ